MSHVLCGRRGVWSWLGHTSGRRGLQTTPWDKRRFDICPRPPPWDKCRTDVCPKGVVWDKCRTDVCPKTVGFEHSRLKATSGTGAEPIFQQICPDQMSKFARCASSVGWFALTSQADTCLMWSAVYLYYKPNSEVSEVHVIVGFDNMFQHSGVRCPHPHECSDTKCGSGGHPAQINHNTLQFGCTTNCCKGRQSKLCVCSVAVVARGRTSS